MALSDSYGLFWNSNNGDRKYNAESFETWLKKFFTSGVFVNELYTTATTGMEISVSGGYANVNGKVRFFEDANTFTLAVASGSNARIDTVVIERNDIDREISMKVVQGAYAVDPVATAPVREDGIYQLVIAEIYVGAGVSTITQADITDKRTDTTVCGYVTGTVDEMDFSQFTSQFSAYYDLFTETNQAEFEQWFETVKGQLDSDVAAHIVKELGEVEDIISSIEPSNVATVAHLEDSYFIYTLNGIKHFAQAETDIDVSDTIANGVNVRHTTIAAELSNYNNLTPVEAPTVTGSYVYNGSEKSAIISTYDTTKIAIGGVTSATNAGEYICTATIYDTTRYCWQDGTTAPKEYTWTIAKRDNYLSVTPTSATGVLAVQTSTTVKVASITQKSTGTVVASTTIGTVAISGNDINLTLPAPTTKYSGIITVSDAGDSNNNPSTKTITLTNVSIVKIVTWSGGTQSELKALIDAADQGLVDLYDDAGWRVGDARDVYVPEIAATSGMSKQTAKTLKMVLLAKGSDTNYTLVTSVKNKSGGTRTKPSFIAGFANANYTSYSFDSNYIATSGSNAKWSNSLLRTWLNDSLWSSSSFFTNLFKQFNVYSASTSVVKATDTFSSTPSLTKTQDYFTIPTYGEYQTYAWGPSTYQAASYAEVTGPELNKYSVFEYYTSGSGRSPASSQMCWTRSVIPSCNYKAYEGSTSKTCYHLTNQSTDTIWYSSTGSSKHQFQPFGVI